MNDYKNCSNCVNGIQDDGKDCSVCHGEGIIKMPVEELKLGYLKLTHSYEPQTDNQRFWFRFGTVEAMHLDRNQAHLLKLWLEEHLK